MLNAIAVTIGRSTDLGAIAAETLEMLRSLTRVDVGAFYRRGRDSDHLILLAQRGGCRSALFPCGWTSSVTMGRPDPTN